MDLVLLPVVEDDADWRSLLFVEMYDGGRGVMFVDTMSFVVFPRDWSSVLRCEKEA